MKSVTPLNVSVGDVMKVKGFLFTPGYAENVVVLVGRDGRVVYVRSEHSTKHSITIHVPQKVESLLKVVNGKRVATQFRVKVIAKSMSRLGKGLLSQPRIGPDVGGDCDKDGIPNPEDADDDGDLLPDTIEMSIRTNPCVGDSDADSLGDGWEYMSAIDLNRNALPYPGKRPYPNALFADQNVDYDGDGLPAWTEYMMWWRGGHKYPLDYSDGNQSTREVMSGLTPWNDLKEPYGFLSDDERDFDGDGLANVLEFGSFEFQPWKGFAGIDRPDFLDADTDGDGLVDGYDDQDHDDISNIEEFVAGTWAMNPCDPLNRASRSCPRWFNADDLPERPEHLCTSTTLADPDAIILGYTGGSSSDAGYCSPRAVPGS